MSPSVAAPVTPVSTTKKVLINTTTDKKRNVPQVTPIAKKIFEMIKAIGGDLHEDDAPQGELSFSSSQSGTSSSTPDVQADLGQLFGAIKEQFERRAKQEKQRFERQLKDTVRQTIDDCTKRIDINQQTFSNKLAQAQSDIEQAINVQKALVDQVRQEADEMYKKLTRELDKTHKEVESTRIKQRAMVNLLEEFEEQNKVDLGSMETTFSKVEKELVKSSKKLKAKK